MQACIISYYSEGSKHVVDVSSDIDDFLTSTASVDGPPSVQLCANALYCAHFLALLYSVSVWKVLGFATSMAYEQLVQRG